MMQLLPVLKIRVDTAGAGFVSGALKTFEYYHFEPATYTKSQLLYTHQTGNQIAYGYKEELVADIVIFTASQYAELLAFGSVDVEITLGLPGETATVKTFLATRLLVNYDVTEGVQKLKVSALQISTAAGVIIPVSQVVFGYGSTPTSFTVDLIDCKVGMQTLKLPVRTGTFKDLERIHGYKRKATLVIAPSAITSRQGFGSSLEAWILSETKYVRTYNFFSETGGYEAFRSVICTNEELIEERLDGIYIGRNLTIDVLDKERIAI